MKNKSNSAVIKIIACPLLFLYKSVNLLKRYLYKKGFFKTYDPGVPVISIGNTVMGGGGKTPTVIWLTKILSSKKKRCVIITRGYGRRNENEEVIIPPLKKRRPDVRTVGDEPALISKILPEIPIICNADRIQASKTAMEHFKPDFIIMDDGYQHMKLRKNIDIVVIPPKHTFWKREFDSAYRQADILIRTGSYLPRQAAYNTNIISAERETGGPVNIRTGKSVDLNRLKGKKVSIVAGIAEPESFIEGIASKGIQCTKRFIFPDHHKYEQSEIDKIEETVLSSKAILTTLKDTVKIEQMNIDASKWFYIPLDLNIEKQDALLKSILDLKSKNS